MFMESSATLLWSLFFGSFGLGYLMYGRKQKKLMPSICGILLMVFPYFISNPVVMVIIGAMLMVLPYFVVL
jgi:hypothetical protein